MRSRRFLALGCACLAAALAAAAAPAWGAEDQEIYNRGRSAVFEERWADARGFFEDLARRYPASPWADDAHYWLGMTLYELGDPDAAYAVLRQMATRYPDSPWNDDSRALMVRCAESALRAAPQRVPGAGPSPAAPGRAEYESFLDRATRDTNAKVQLLAIDTVLESNPGKAPELLPRLNAGKSSREAAGLVLDRFFAGGDVKVTIENPALGLREDNVAIIVRQGETISYVTLSEATEMIRSGGSAAGRFGREVVSEMRDKLVQAQRNLVREGDPGTVATVPSPDGRSRSAIVKVVDGEVHYYSSGDETVRVVVLRRSAGFNDDNVKVFVENRDGAREIRMGEVRQMPGRPGSGVMSEATLRYLKAALAIIEIDLSRVAGTATQ